MGLVDFFTAVEAYMTVTLAALDPPVTPPVFRIGADKLQIQDAPNRVVWVPGGETIQGPHAQGGDGVRNPRPLRTRHTRVLVHIWGAGPGLVDATADRRPGDIAATEVMLGHLVAAIHDVAYGAYQALAGDWLVGQEAATTMGALYVLTLEVQFPLTRELDVYAVVNTVPITPEIDPAVVTG
jgi:hypothetical protein